jgi:hypothetical protein
MKYTGVCDKCGGQAVARIGVGYSSTLVGYGRCDVNSEHLHDDNCQAGSFRCAEGHTFPIYRRRRCGDENGPIIKGWIRGPAGPACDWTGRESCNICSANHVDWPDVPVEERE